MADYTIKVRRYQPESGDPAYWEEFNVELDPSLSVLDGILQAKDREDGSLAVRCSCRAAICGSCGMKINGQSGLGCQTQIGEAQELADKMKSQGLPSSVIKPKRPDEPYRVVLGPYTSRESADSAGTRLGQPYFLYIPEDR